MNPHSIAVFLGPSLGLKQARELLTADYFPPARKGDIYRIMASGVKTIVLVDGVFHNTPSVWPREIVDALEEDIQVIGAASMGALRAAELHQFGMVGHGTVFEWYRDGVIEGDDEVAVSHASAEYGFRPLSEALVNIRCTLDRAVGDCCVAAEQANQLLDYAKHLYYPERSYQKLLSSPVVSRWSEQDRATIHHYFLHGAVNLKAEDAIGALRLAARMPGTRVAVGYDGGRSQEDFFQLDRLRLTGFVGRQGIVTGETVLEEAQRDPDLLASMRATLSKRCLLLEWARRNNINCAEEVLDAYFARWKKYHKIDENEDWLRANGLTRKFCRSLLEERALIDWITRKGPAHFGVDWNFEQALYHECGLLGRTAGLGPPARDFSGIQPELFLDQEQDEAAARVWVDLSHRRFLLEWARQIGISCASGPLRTYCEQWERTHPVGDRAARLESTDLKATTYHDPLGEMAMVDWIARQGPNYFGLSWEFEDALLRELQTTGRAAQLVENHRRS